EHRLSATRFQLFALIVVVEELLSAVVLHTPCGFLEQSHLVGRCGTHLHRSPEGWPCQHVRDGRMTGDAHRLRLTRLELFGFGEPDVHPCVQISGGPLAIPAAGPRPFRARLALASGECRVEASAEAAQQREERRTPKSLCPSHPFSCYV